MTLPATGCVGVALVALVALVLCAVRSAWGASLVAVGALVLGGLGVAVAVEMRRASSGRGWSGRPRLRAWATYRVVVSSALSLGLSAIALVVAF
jgi:hypothetical protein